MRDQFERKIEYLRISVTDRCNFRCVYCMPEEGVKSLAHEEILTFDEILRLAGCFAELGITKIKITGGEPLVRKGITSLIGDLKKVKGVEEVTLTTNGLLLKSKIDELKAAGVDAINVSLDTLNPEKFAKITRSEGLDKVLEGIKASLDSGIKTRINTVSLKDLNAEDSLEIAGLAKEYPLAVRFIETMPIGLGKDFVLNPQSEIIEALIKHFGTPEISAFKGNGPAKYYVFPGFLGKIGFISAVTHGFCAECNRVRLTSNGSLKLCLQFDDGVDLKALLRSGATDGEIIDCIRSSIYNKPRAHEFGAASLEDAKLSKDRYETKCMNEIGG